MIIVQPASEISGEHYGIDQQMRAAVSGKAGHQREFILCHETRQPIARAEAEYCKVAGNRVRPGGLEACEITGKHVLPSELERCMETGTRAMRLWGAKIRSRIFWRYPKSTR